MFIVELVSQNLGPIKEFLRNFLMVGGVSDPEPIREFLLCPDNRCSKINEHLSKYDQDLSNNDQHLSTVDEV